MSEDSLLEEFVDWKGRYEKLKKKYDEKAALLHQFHSCSEDELKLLLRAEKKRNKDLGVTNEGLRRKVDELGKLVAESKELRDKQESDARRELNRLEDVQEFKLKYLSATNQLQQARSEIASLAREGVARTVLAAQPVDQIAELKKQIRVLKHPAATFIPPKLAVVVDNKRVGELEQIVEAQRKELVELKKVKMALKSRADVVEAQLVERRNEIKVLLPNMLTPRFRQVKV